MDWPVILHHNGKHQPNSNWFDYQAQCGMEVWAWTMGKSLCKKTSFIHVNGTISFMFYTKQPLPLNSICRRSNFNQIYCLNSNKCIKFSLQHFSPVRVRKCLFVCIRTEDGESVTLTLNCSDLMLFILERVTMGWLEVVTTGELVNASAGWEG